ncbi:hypothetical protein Tco_0546965 [Tanacetum coccineum]
MSSNSGHETDENESDSKSDHQENEEEDEDDEEEVKDKFVKTPSNDSDDEDETKTTGKDEGNENPEISQVIEDAHVTLFTDPQKTEVPVTSSSHSSDLAAKFLNFSDIPHTDAEIVSPMDVHVHHEVPGQQTPTLLTVPVSVITDSSPISPPSSHKHYHPLLLYHNNQYPLQILNLHFLISHQSSNSTTESQH